MKNTISDKPNKTGIRENIRLIVYESMFSPLLMVVQPHQSG
nr:hypothetical protein [Bacillus infantis]